LPAAILPVGPTDPAAGFGQGSARPSPRTVQRS
jgi:hypothetical protein